MFVRASLYKRREESQRDATECFIALIIVRLSRTISLTPDT